MKNQAQVVFQAADTRDLDRGPGDSSRFLVTGEQSGGSSFVLIGGSPPHRLEEESFFPLGGALTVSFGERAVLMKPGDFVLFPRGSAHGFKNEGQGFARMLALFSRTGMEGWFRAAHDRAPDRAAVPTGPTKAMLAPPMRVRGERGCGRGWSAQGPRSEPAVRAREEAKAGRRAGHGLQVRPGKTDGFVRIFEGSSVPALVSQPGFRGTRLFADPTLGRGLGLTLWESEADMTAFEASGRFREQFAMFQPVLGAPATLERFEVRRWGRPWR